MLKVTNNADFFEVKLDMTQLQLWIAGAQQPDVTVVKVYRPQDSTQVHQTRIAPCPEQFPAGYFWYGGKRAGPGRPPKWVK